MRTRIGVTGHRLLADDPDPTAAVDGVLAEVEARYAAPLALVSGMATGADELVGRRALARGWTLHAYLPLPLGRFTEDFDERDRERLHELVALAAEVRDAGGGEDRPECYRAAGLALLDDSDGLIALWNGGAARGPGGTGEIVERRARGASLSGGSRRPTRATACAGSSSCTRARRVICLFITLMNSRGRWRVLAVGWIATAILGMWGLAAAPGDTGFLDNLYTLRGRLHARPQRRARLGQLAAPDRALAGPARGRRLAARGPRGRLAPPDRRFQAARRRRPLGRARARRARHADRRGLSDAGRAVVAVEVDRGDGGIRRLRRRGCKVVEGDAREQRTLKKAGVPGGGRGRGRLRRGCHQRQDRSAALASWSGRRAHAGCAQPCTCTTPASARCCATSRCARRAAACASTSSTSTPRAPVCCWSGIRWPRPRTRPPRTSSSSASASSAAASCRRRRVIAGDAGIAITLVDRDAAGAARRRCCWRSRAWRRRGWRAVDVDLERPGARAPSGCGPRWATRPRSRWPSTTMRARSPRAC